MSKTTLPELEPHPFTPNQSQRLAPVTLIVVHRWGVPAFSSFDGIVNNMMHPDREISAHIVYAGEQGRDKGRAVQLVPWNRKAWACISFNSRSDNIELGDAMWSGLDSKGFARAARIVAGRLHYRGLPAVWRHGSALNGSAGGFTRHYDLGAAGGGHTDPTTNPALWDRFCELVQAEHARGGFRPKWGAE